MVDWKYRQKMEGLGKSDVLLHFATVECIWQIFRYK